MSITANSIKATLNGDSVIGFTSYKDWKASEFIDAAKFNAYFLDGEPGQHTKYLGLLNLFATTENISVPTMQNLMKDAAVLTVEEGQTITYDLTVNREASKCKIIEDTSGDSETPGIDETVFRLILSKPFAKGDILTADAQRGQQVFVSNDFEIQPWGEGYLHHVTLGENAKAEWYDNSKLKVGTEYHKIDHVMGEFDTDYSNIDLSGGPTGSIRNEFLLGDPRGVSSFYTNKANNMRSEALKRASDGARQQALAKLDALGGKDSMFIVSKNLRHPSGQLGFHKGSAMVGTTLEYLLLAELAKMEAHSLMFAQAATFHTNNGSKRINEGLYHQQRRGKIIEYAERGGITMNHISQASAYIFKNNTMPVLQRRIRFTCGSMAFANMELLFRDYIKQQLDNMPTEIFGTASKVSGNLFTGSLDNLHMNAVVFKSVQVPGVGTIEIVLDESMDYQPFTDRLNTGFFGQGLPRTSYSMVIEDATNPANSNVTSKVNGAKLVEGGKSNANIYYVTPESGSLVYGYEQGRMPDGNQNFNVQSSMKQMAREIWGYTNSSALMLDTTRYICIELAQPVTW
jgi:hypothetical protein